MKVLLLAMRSGTKSETGKLAAVLNLVPTCVDCAISDLLHLDRLLH
jgi:hypothetical protein